MLDLVISIINTNNKDFLKQCLESIFKQTGDIDCDVFVVDNASIDGSADMVKEHFPQVKLILNNKRLGFTTNHNKVLKTTTAHFKMILNEDTVLKKDSIKGLLGFVKKHKDIGAIGPRMLFGDGSFQHSAFYLPNLENELCKMLSSSLFSDKSRGIYGEEKCKDIFVPEWLNGACILFNSKALSDVGYLDENFFIFYEDADICKRLSDGGWRVYYYPDAKIIHYYGKSQKGKILQELIALHYRSRLRYFLKHKGIIRLLILKILTLSINLLKLLKYSLLLVFLRKTAHSQEIKNRLSTSLIGIKVCLSN